MSGPRTLLVTQDFPPMLGGIATVFFNIASHFDPGRMIVAATPCTDAEAFDRNLPFQIVRAPFEHRRAKVFGYNLAWCAGLARLVRREGVGVIQCGTVLPMGYMGLILKRWSGVPYVVYTMGVDNLKARAKQRASPALRLLINRIFSEAARVITISRYTRSLLLEMGVPPGKIAVLCRGVDIRAFTPGPRDPELAAHLGVAGRPVLMTAARLDPRKGIDTVIRALPRIRARAPGVVYLVVGDGPERERLTALAHDPGVADGVRFAGAVSHEAMPAYYRLCDVYVMTSREIPGELERRGVETFGVVYLEAGATGKPVVAGRSGGVLDAVVDGETGLVVDPEDVEAVAGAAVRLLTEPSLAAQMGAAGREHAERFAWDRVVADIDALVTEVAARSS
jgi:phosphatidylinositol alpha-1,6-mannosyltransferase